MNLEEEPIPDTVETFQPATLSYVMSREESAARDATASVFTKAMLEEAKRHGRSGSYDAAYFVLEQAREYMAILNGRNPYDQNPDQYDTDTDPEDDPDIGSEVTAGLQIRDQATMELMRAMEDLEERLAQEENLPEYDPDRRHHPATALALATSEVLEIHNTMMNGAGPLKDGHRQAAQGLAMTLREVTIWMEQNGPPTGRTEMEQHRRATQSAQQAMDRFDRNVPLVRRLTETVFHKSLEDTPADMDEAQELIEKTMEMNRSFGACLRGDPPNGHDSLMTFYHEGKIHAKRLEDEYPEDLHGEQAIEIADAIGEMLGFHAMDHAEDWLPQTPEFLTEMIEDAKEALHTLPRPVIDRMLDIVAKVTESQGALVATLALLLGNPEIAMRHARRWSGARYPEREQPDWDRMAREKFEPKRVEFETLEEVLKGAAMVNCGRLELAGVSRYFGWHEDEDPLSDWLAENSVLDLG